MILNGVYFDTDRAIALVDEIDTRVDTIDRDLIPNLPIRYKPRGVPVSRPFIASGDYSKMSKDWYPDLDIVSNSYVGGPFTRVEEHRLDINSISLVSVSNM